ncbi:hypothetical protein BGZ94_009848 [Podila epigama]|nr:hypothetical protein BGZ94_009848 [Podila epigama]
MANNSAELLTKDNATPPLISGEHSAAPTKHELPHKGVDNEDRKPRSEQEMAREATRLASLLEISSEFMVMHE